MFSSSLRQDVPSQIFTNPTHIKLVSLIGRVVLQSDRQKRRAVASCARAMSMLDGTTGKRVARYCTRFADLFSVKMGTEVAGGAAFGRDCG